jgi:Thioesterase superfamily
VRIDPLSRARGARVPAGRASADLDEQLSAWLAEAHQAGGPPCTPKEEHSAIHAAVQTALPPATPFTTAEISFKFVRTVVPQSGTLTAKGRLIHAGKTTGVSLAEVTDEAGRLVAVTSTRCAILPRVEVPWEVVEQALKNPPRLREPQWPSPHPYERPVAGEVLSQEIWDGADGLGVLQSLITGDLPAPPVAHFCGIAPVDAKAGTTTWKMPASRRA